MDKCLRLKIKPTLLLIQGTLAEEDAPCICGNAVVAVRLLACLADGDMLQRMSCIRDGCIYNCLAVELLAEQITESEVWATRLGRRSLPPLRGMKRAPLGAWAWGAC